MEQKYLSKTPTRAEFYKMIKLQEDELSRQAKTIAPNSYPQITSRPDMSANPNQAASKKEEKTISGMKTLDQLMRHNDQAIMELAKKHVSSSFSSIASQKPPTHGNSGPSR